LVDHAQVLATLENDKAAIPASREALRLIREDEVTPLGSSKGSTELARALLVQARSYNDLRDYA
jgi:hypothetical protein